MKKRRYTKPEVEKKRIKTDFLKNDAGSFDFLMASCNSCGGGLGSCYYCNAVMECRGSSC